MLIDPNFLTDFTGILVIFTMVYLQWVKTRKVKVSLEQAI